MKINSQLTDDAVLAELGRRLKALRLERVDLTQERLGIEAGVSTATVARIEAGQSAQLTSLVRILRYFNLLEALELMLPEPGPSPIAELERSGRERQRARARRQHPGRIAESEWRWGDEGPG
jgi:transcriptional regulator with XRE-family HTH domain